MKTLQQLSAKAQQKVFALMAKDERVRELYLTMLVRPLNALEQLMFKQILEEYCDGIKTATL